MTDLYSNSRPFTAPVVNLPAMGVGTGLVEVGRFRRVVVIISILNLGVPVTETIVVNGVTGGVPAELARFDVDIVSQVTIMVEVADVRIDEVEYQFPTYTGSPNDVRVAGLVFGSRGGGLLPLDDDVCIAFVADSGRIIQRCGA